MKLIYSYSTKMGNYDDNDWILLLFKASITRSKQLGYTIKLYGCNFAYDKLKDVIDEYVDITNEEFILTDDLKLYIHSKEDLDCITIDGDIILEHKLDLSKKCDIFFERKGQVKNSKSITKFQKYLNVFKKYDVESNINYFNYDVHYACNMGILKFNNQNIKDLFISSYYNFRKYYLDVIEPIENLTYKNDPAIIVCEYMFACIIEQTTTKVKFCKDFNNYTHYMSNDKFTLKAWKHANDILNKKHKLI